MMNVSEINCYFLRSLNIQVTIFKELIKVTVITLSEDKTGK